jgi:hypothetical protein
MSPRRSFITLLAGAALALGASAPAIGGTSPGGSTFDPKVDRETHLLSTAMDGGFPNGPSRNAAFSQDRQLATRAAYESDASDIVPGDANGFTDVFVVTRAEPYDENGPPWRAERTDLVSRGIGGAPANGPSYLPDLDGDQLHRAGCVAFVSAASNLVPGDTNGKPDAFVRNLRTGRTKRVSVNSQGRQSNGTTYDVKVDGACDRVAFTSDATNLALTRAGGRRRKLLHALVTSAPPAGTKQVYVRLLGGQQDDRGYDGTTFLASASHGRAGNASSYDVAIGKLGRSCPQHCGTTSGDEIAYTSEASNLSGRDRNGQPDVYRTEFTVPSFDWKAARSAHRMTTRTTLVSSAGGGRAGNGPSSHAAVNDAGDWVAFETGASDILPGDSNGVSDVADAHLVGGRVKKVLWVSKSAAVGEPGNGDSHDPVIARPGSPVFFESLATNLQPNDPGTSGGYHDENDAQDVFFWNFVSGNDSLQSRDSNNSIVNLPIHWEDIHPQFPSPPAENPAASYYGNYMAFETSYPLFDLQITSRLFPGLELNPRRVSELGSSDAALHQVYLRYIGPR